jgi:hypothetical protein
VERDVRCIRCREWFAERSMILATGNILACGTCWPGVWLDHKRPCIRCGYDYIPNPRIPANRRKICHRCRWFYPPQERVRVKRQVSRANVLGVEHSLKPSDWLLTVEHFNGLCVYCQLAEFSSMDHFTSLEKGGGAVAWNTVPCCRSCDGRKRSDRTPSLDAADLEGVSRYLATLRQNR